jgi:LPS-assembly protein
VSRRRSWSAVAPLACGAALAAAVCVAGAQINEPRPPEQEITVDAESLSYDKQQDTVSATGDVVIRRGDSVLRADEVLLDRQTNEAQARGEAVLTTPEAQIRASSMALDLDDETGELTDAHIYSDKLGYTLSGDRIEKRVGQSYRIENGQFTTCNCDEGPPSWSIAGDSLDVALDGYGYLESGTFQILDHPVLWIPRAAFPVYRERQSGFLFPRVGFSNRRGFQLLQPYYWAINKSQDATISLDVETSLRIGVLTEYRYAFSQTAKGAFQFGYFNEFLRGNETSNIRVPNGINPNAPENRWGLIGNHIQDVGPAKGYVDLLLVGDDLFLREMNTFTANERQEVDLRTRPFTTSRVGLLQEWSRAFVQAEGVYYQDLIGPIVNPNGSNPQQEQSLVIQRAPEVDLTAQKQLGFGLLGNFNGSVTDFQRGTGLTGFRGDLHPGVELRVPLGPSFYGALQGGFRETAYGLTQNKMFGGFTGTDPAAGEVFLPSGSSRELFDVHGEVGTELGRVYDFHYFGLDKLKHTIEPTVEYLYIPPVDQSDLPVFDGIDRINRRSLLTYGIATRLLGRTEGSTESQRGEVFELVRLSATQSYDFIRTIPPTTNPQSGALASVPPGDHFSDIDFALRVNPNPVTSIRAYATYDTSENELSSATVGIRLREPQQVFGKDIRPRLLTRATFNVEYRFITDNIVQLLDSSIALPITDRIAALYAMRYDINAGSFLENYVGMRLLSSCDCWALNVGMTQTRNPNEFQVQAQFTLAGLGNAPGNGGLRNY